MAKIIVQETEITVLSHNDRDYISLTDMANGKQSESRAADIIKNWIRTRYTIEFLGTWEMIHNPDFKVVEFDHFRMQAGLPNFVMSVSEWIEKTNAIGIIVKKGRYGGTYAFKDIAFEFGTAISVTFKLYLIEEFQRLKADEQKQLAWSAKRELSKINYRIHTDAIKSNLIPAEVTKEQANVIYAEEADVLNVAMFGMTAKQWREANPTLKGNIRDYATINELICLSNMENINAVLINDGMSQGEQQFKYNGKEYDPMHGLNEYDYGARQYDPAIGKFTTMDPLCEKYYHISPYAYCLGNPVLFFDPNGEEPSKEEAARMAMHVTGRWGNWILSGGWELDKEKEHLDLIKNNFGLKSQLYVRKIDGKNEYAYVTAGTDFFSAEDWLNNILQLVGQSPQYKEATENAIKLVEKLGSNVLTFVGFSLGGGLASANALATGEGAITFNAAGLSNATIKKLGLYNQKGTINAYIVQGEILDKTQRYIGLKAEGNIKYMPSMFLPLSPELLLLQPIISHDINLINAYYYIKDLLK